MPEKDAEGAAEGKLIAGKYKSVEEAEKALEEQARLLGRQGEELGKLRQAVTQLQQYVQQSATAAQGAPDQEEAISAALLENPTKFFREFGTHLTLGVLDLVNRQVGQRLEIERTVERFVEKNPLAGEHPELFVSYFTRTDSNKSVGERLIEAHTRLKDTLTQAAKTQASVARSERQSLQKVSITPGAESEGLETLPAESEGESLTPEEATLRYVRERQMARGKVVL